MTAPVTTPTETVDADTSIDPDRPWVVLVWNDPINLMSYVTHVLQKLFGYNREKATALMLGETPWPFLSAAMAMAPLA